MKGKAIQKAGRMKMNPNQFFAMLVERAVSDENSLFVERSELENALKQNHELRQNISKIDAQRVAEIKEMQSLVESLKKSVEADKKQDAEIKSLANQLASKIDTERAEHQKTVKELKKAISDLTLKNNKLVQRINAANAFLKESQFFGKAKQF